VSVAAPSRKPSGCKHLSGAWKLPRKKVRPTGLLRVRAGERREVSEKPWSVGPPNQVVETKKRDQRRPSAIGPERGGWKSIMPLISQVRLNLLDSDQLPSCLFLHTRRAGVRFYQPLARLRNRMVSAILFGPTRGRRLPSRSDTQPPCCTVSLPPAGGMSTGFS